jgi:hypothetical protein
MCSGTPMRDISQLPWSSITTSPGHPASDSADLLPALIHPTMASYVTAHQDLACIFKSPQTTLGKPVPSAPPRAKATTRDVFCQKPRWAPSSLAGQQGGKINHPEHPCCPIQGPHLAQKEAPSGACLCSPHTQSQGTCRDCCVTCPAAHAHCLLSCRRISVDPPRQQH